MTDDFRLFENPDDGGPAIEPDIAIITAYLARELTPVQDAAIRQRLEADPDFRRAVQPAIDGWTADPHESAIASVPNLTREQHDAGWQRHVTELQHRRRFVLAPPWRRAAAIIVLVTLPALGLAQAARVLTHWLRSAGHGAENTGGTAPSIPRPPAFHRSLGAGESAGPAPITLGAGHRLNMSRGGGGNPLPLPAIRALGPIEARFSQLFPSRRDRLRPSIRQLSNGTVLLSDRSTRQLLLFDSSLSRPRVILDSTSADPKLAYAPEWRNGGVTRPNNPHGRLIPLAGDTTLFLDASAQVFLVISPSGEVSRTRPAPDTPSSGPTLPAFDRLGRAWYTGVTTESGRMKPTYTQPVDSVPLYWRDPGGKGEDAAFLKVNPRFGTISPSSPITVNDDWAFVSDGSLAVVRSVDFHIDWIEPNGTRRSTPPVQFDWRPLSDDHKQALVDSLKALMTAHPIAIGLSLTGPGSYKYYPAYVRDVVPPSALPDYEPAFSRYTAIGDADQRLWIRVLGDGELPPPNVEVGPVVSSLRPTTATPLYYVIDKSGAVVDRVRLSEGWEIIGFGAGGAVYLLHATSDAKWEVGRARLR